MPSSPQESNFEQQFFQLAFQKLQDKVGKLLPYLIGFEVKKKNEEGTKAVGTFCFKSPAGNVIMVPAFFVNGAVQDLPLLYAKDSDQMLPLDEEYAQKFLEGPLSLFGDKSTSSIEDVRAGSRQGNDFRDLVRPPVTGKISTASDASFDDMAFVKAASASDFDLIAFVKAQGLEREFYSMLKREPEFLDASMRFYSTEKLAEASVATPDEPKSPVKSKVKVVEKQKPSSEDLSDKDKKKLLQEGYIIKDKRDKGETNEWFGSKVQYAKTFTNPTRSGFFAYLTQAGDLRLAMVLLNPKPVSSFRANGSCFVLDLETGKGFMTESSKLFIKNEVVVEDLKAFFDKMESASEVQASDSYDATTYIAVTSNLNSIMPFKVRASFTDAEGHRRLVIDPSVYGMEIHPAGKLTRPHKEASRTKVVVITKGESDRADLTAPVQFMSSAFKFLAVKRLDYKDEQDAQLRPGSLLTLTTSMQANGFFPTTVRANGSEFFVNIGQVRKHFKDKKSMKVAMVIGGGLTEDTVDQILKEAGSYGRVEGYIKQADLGGYQPYMPEDVPGVGYDGQPEHYGNPMLEVQNDPSAPMDHAAMRYKGQIDEPQGPDTQHVQQALQLAQSGQKELFDAGAIGALAKYVSPHNKLSQYNPDLLRALDRLGRIIFMFNWDTDKFVEMFGRDDLPEFKELLNNVFRNLGDLVLFLQRKSPELTINDNGESPI